MKRRLPLATGFACALASAAAAQAPPRAPDGHPDLTGVWSNASLTQLERTSGAGLVVPDAEAKARAARNARALAAAAQPSRLDDGLLDQTVIGVPFNSFWRDAGTSLGRVKGRFRSSWIVEPADGRLPLTAAGRARAREAAATANVMAPAGPEAMAPNDRCLIASRGSGGPGMLNNIYNSNYQIVQTPRAVAIVVEMVHDARTIPIFPTRAAAQAGHGPAVLQPWLGDSVGWWDGDALVVETVNVNPAEGVFGPIFLSPGGRVTERLTRVSPREIDYAFEVEDPVYYTAPWRAELSLNAISGPVYEYACHEGNYAMRGVLAAGNRQAAPRGP
ncbi:hypothetical protein [Phenylobacterium sp.]|uniref:hypothetical protein n=1 Tax=Phenylobacterium sp. TaxID=1871053 RepID=UPI0025EA8271|nr:hypothetical protein [Phenylobacterium sp.]